MRHIARSYRPKVDGCGYYGQVKNGIVGAVDAELASVSQQQRGQCDFDNDAVNPPAVGQPGNQRPFQ